MDGETRERFEQIEATMSQFGTALKQLADTTAEFSTRTVKWMLRFDEGLTEIVKNVGDFSRNVGVATQSFDERMTRLEQNQAVAERK